LRIVGHMRILMLCTRYPLEPNDRYMTNELVAALAAAGHHVQVVVTDWDATRRPGARGERGALAVLPPIGKIGQPTLNRQIQVQIDTK
jgi:hypothetical protein